MFVDCPKTILKVFKKHVTGTNFHKKPKSTKIIKSNQYFLLSEKSTKWSKFWLTFLKSGSATLIIGQSIIGNQRSFVLLKEGQVYYYKKIFIFAKHNVIFAGSKSHKILRFAWMYLRKFPMRKNFTR